MRSYFLLSTGSRKKFNFSDHVTGGTTLMGHVLAIQILHGPDQWFRLAQQVMILYFPTTVRDLFKVVITFLIRLLTSRKGLA